MSLYLTVDLNRRHLGKILLDDKSEQYGLEYPERKLSLLVNCSTKSGGMSSGTCRMRNSCRQVNVPSGGGCAEQGTPQGRCIFQQGIF